MTNFDTENCIFGISKADGRDWLPNRLKTRTRRSCLLILRIWHKHVTSYFVRKYSRTIQNHRLEIAALKQLARNVLAPLEFDVCPTTALGSAHRISSAHATVLQGPVTIPENVPRPFSVTLQSEMIIVGVATDGARF